MMRATFLDHATPDTRSVLAAKERVRRAVGVGLGALIVVAWPFASACSCDPPNPAPAPVECVDVDGAAPTMLELGDTTSPFVPSAHAESVRGGQGLTMLAFRIGVQAEGTPTCIAQRTQAGPTLFGQPLRIVGREGDWWVTAPLYVITDSVAIPVQTTLGTLTVTRTMSIAVPDAGADAR